MTESAAAAFNAWARARQHRLVRSAYLMTGDWRHAEDLVQEALLKVASRWERVGDGNQEAYVRRILWRDHVSWWRRRRPTLLASLPDRPAAGDDDLSELRLVARQALDRLTIKQRAVLVLRFYDDLSERETALVLQVSVGTVKSQTSAALARLRAHASELRTLLGIEGEQ